MNEPEWLLHCQRILALPDKRYVKRSVTFLDGPEIAALLAAPDRSTWTGRRDHILLLVALQTGLRASELTGLRRRDLVLGTGAHVRCLGKGRKERCTPLRRDTAKALQNWLKEWRSDDDGPLFPSIRGDPDRKSAVSGKSVSVRVDLGGSRNFKKKNTNSTANRSICIPYEADR